MSGLKQLKGQMKTVETTSKITTAMRMIAVSNLKKSHQLLLDAYPYLGEITRMLRRLVRSVSFRQNELSAQGSKEIIPLPALLKGRDSSKKHYVICVTSNQGLCGHFNQSIISKTQELVDFLLKEDTAEVVLICFGNRGAETLKKKYPALRLHVVPRQGTSKNVLFLQAEKMGMNLINSFLHEDFDVCTIVYSEFKSAAIQKIKIDQIIPLQTFNRENKWQFLIDNTEPDYIKRDVLGQKKLNETDARLFAAIGGQKIKSPLGQIDADALLKESTRLPDSYDYDKSDIEILNAMMLPFINAHVYQILLNSLASENAARMIAMESASKNASEMMKFFQKKYHRKRQEIVTRDLTEVVAGSMN